MGKNEWVEEYIVFPLVIFKESVSWGEGTQFVQKETSAIILGILKEYK